jgi:DNA polymerase
MIIGDAPNPLEDREGKPFVGEEGDLLDKMFDAIGYSRYSKTEKSIYMSSLIPWKPLHTQSSIKPEVEMLLPFIKKHIEIINPKFLVFMGNDPLDSLLQDITENKKPGTWINFLDIDSLIMHHPKYLIKNPSAKKEAWKDLLLLKEKLHDV